MPTPSLEADQALASLADGDPSAVDRVFDLLWPLVRAYCRRQLANPADAEDAAQRALLKLLEHAPSYDPARPALGFALGFAHWECRTELTRRKRSRQVPLPELHSDATPEQLALEKERAELLDSALAGLSNDERALLLRDPASADAPSPAAERKRRQRLLERVRVALAALLEPRRAP